MNDINPGVSILNLIKIETSNSVILRHIWLSRQDLYRGKHGMVRMKLNEFVLPSKMLRFHGSG